LAAAREWSAAPQPWAARSGSPPTGARC